MNFVPPGPDAWGSSYAATRVQTKTYFLLSMTLLVNCDGEDAA